MSVEQSPEQRYLVIRNVTLIGVIGNILLSFIKLIFGWLGNSQALIADGIHSLSDLISDAVVLVAAKWSTEQADDKHPYGHGRIETLAAVIVGGILIFVAIVMLFDAAQRLWEAEYLFIPTTLSLVVAFLSIVIKEALFQYTIIAAKKLRSPMLKANAWHHRTDAISSVMVFFGIAGTFAGFMWLDAVAAIGVSFMIAHVGWELAWKGLQELIDTAMDAEKVAEIEHQIKAIDGVRTLHMLRTRYMGSHALVDVHLLVNPRISVSEGHQIAETARQTLIDEFDEISEVTVHIDPENDEEYSVRIDLPTRNQLVEQLKQCWIDMIAVDKIEHVTLHYLGGKISAEVVLPMNIAQDISEAHKLSTKLCEQAKSQTCIRQVQVFFR
ncbi:cation diffusion facilitator family transporter [Candidatus Albibeggiatoa sp. nov. NOAA]|uniref:cation diffusion facilitator family transporter n=1 Tax=Candidatus Albibeggiatoa sp. nov. NOAA TaxID=3162724 RepID=UPI0032F323EE|nr:cation diffusion facilitator family transporter [Thiotrichaceae bacterium]